MSDKQPPPKIGVPKIRLSGVITVGKPKPETTKD